MSERNVQSEIITPDQSHSGVEGLLQIVSVKVGNEEFGLDILRVQEIIRIQGLTRVPNSPVFVAGVIRTGAVRRPGHQGERARAGGAPGQRRRSV